MDLPQTEAAPPPLADQGPLAQTGPLGSGPAVLRDGSALEPHSPAVDSPAAASASDASARLSQAASDFDRALHAEQAKFTGFLSPISLGLAQLDWAMHLANAPGRRLELAQEALARSARLWSRREWIAPSPGDRRFSGGGWDKPPFDFFAQSFLQAEAWWASATSGAEGVAKHHADLVSFFARQALDIVAPSNFVATNPEALNATVARSGANLIEGWKNFSQDLEWAAREEPASVDPSLRVGESLATTPGRVVLRNELMELIQYLATTNEVRPQPLLIVPAWIMKYYILDLSPHNSLVRFLTAQGFTVFCISWKNPGPELANTGLDDYRRRGVMAALDAISAICGGARIHACGYCLGGTLLSIAAATMARDGDDRLASVSLLAAQTDFSEAGELQLFSDESQLALLEDVMRRQGYLDSAQMAGAFDMLRSNDLVWSRAVRAYLLGEREQPSDLMAWNADGTRMPARMHAEYLRHMFLDNDLAEGRLFVEGRPATPAQIKAPIFALGTQTDHVAPWRSVYKIHLLNQGDVTFTLTSGGHNAGVVSEPGHRGRQFQMARRPSGAPYVAPEEWAAAAPMAEGSWWPAWVDWLGNLSGPFGPLPSLGTLDGAYPVVGDAPGIYVLEK